MRAGQRWGLGWLLVICSGVGNLSAQELQTEQDASIEQDVGTEKAIQEKLLPAETREVSREEALESLDRHLAYLVTTQKEDGSWATSVIEGVLDVGYSVASFYDWQVASHALACMALRQCEPTESRTEALTKALHWMCRTRIPKRGSDWDNDTVWAGLYGTIACVDVLGDDRFLEGDLHDAIEKRGREFLDILIRNQVPTGGWGYYDDPPYSKRPKWGTSFSTACVIPALMKAFDWGWFDDRRIIERAVKYVARCALPNGAFEYDLRPIPRAGIGESINHVKGSLGRIQVCLWALREAGHSYASRKRLREGIEQFLKKHRFLDVARMRPIPHEAYYANAGYFYFFGHYYAACAIEQLPEEEQEAWHRKLRYHVIKTQRSSGNQCDFIDQEYLVVSSTAFAALTLIEGLR